MLSQGLFLPSFSGPIKDTSTWFTSVLRNISVVGKIPELKQTTTELTRLLCELCTQGICEMYLSSGKCLVCRPRKYSSL